MRQAGGSDQLGVRSPSLRHLLGLTHLPMALFLAGIVPVSIVVFAGLESQKVALLAGSTSVPDHIAAAQLVWAVCLAGFLAACLAGTALTLWCHRRIQQRIGRQLAFCDALLEGRELPELSPRDRRGTFSRMDLRLVQMAAVLDQRNEALRRDAAAERSHTRLARAMAMTDSEDEAFDLTRLALQRLVPEAGAEVLLADSSMARMSRVLEHGCAPGCEVLSPSKCHAVRRGSPQVFSDSQELDACPRLRARGELGAACVPISVMGRSVGVLHVTTDKGRAPTDDTVARLTFLADQLGTRMGMLRALATTQLQADTDALTGLLNRRSFEGRARRYLEQEACTIVMADLDHFKRLNDTFGHHEGDKALRVFARLAREMLGPHGLVGRHGGEEFVFLFPEEPGRVRGRLEALRMAMPSAIEAAGAQVFTASFGMALGQAGRELAGLVTEADAALYRAKEAGRDRVEGPELRAA